MPASPALWPDFRITSPAQGSLNLLLSASESEATIPGKLAAYNYGQLSMEYWLFQITVVDRLGVLGFPVSFKKHPQTCRGFRTRNLKPSEPWPSGPCPKDHIK